MTRLCRRDLPGEFHVRSEEDSGGAGELLGVVTTYNSPYPIPGAFREQVMEGAFDASLEKHPVIPVYLQHGHIRGAAPIGEATKALGESGRLTMLVRLYLEDSGDARVAYRAARSGALREWSVGMFYGKNEGDIDVDSAERLVSIREADLREISLVLIGQNPETETLDVREFCESDPPMEFVPRTDAELAEFVLNIYPTTK